MASWNQSYVVEIEVLDAIKNILYAEIAGNGIIFALSFIGSLLCIGRLVESSETQTTQLTSIILLLWLCLLICSATSTADGVIHLVTENIEVNENLCYRIWEVSTLMYTTSHVLFYGVLLHRAQASRSLVRGDRIYKLLSKTILVVTLGAPILTTIVALVLTKGVLLRDSSGRVFCRPKVLPSASILVAVLDSILSLGYLLLFIIPLQKAIAPMVQPCTDRDLRSNSTKSQLAQVEMKIVDKQQRTNSNLALTAARQELVQITKRNLLLSAIQIVGTFVCMLTITVSSLVPMPYIQDSISDKLSNLNESIYYGYLAALLDMAIMSVVLYKLTTAWIPRKVVHANIRKSIHPHRFATGNTGLSRTSKRAVESSVGGLSEL